MLRALDLLLRDLLVANLTGFTAAQVRFEPPDSMWRASILAQLPDGVVDFALVDARENRKLRTNERLRTIEFGVAIDEPAPTRIDFHYLVTTWFKATPKVNLQPALDEHQLLYDVAAVLVRHAPFNPARVYFGGSPNWPAPYDDIELPVAVAPHEGFTKLSEFWTTLGPTARWKPAIWLVVTLPITLIQEQSGPMVTTRIATWRSSANAIASVEVLMQLGGHVTDASAGPPVPIEGAWVQLEHPAGRALQSMHTNDLGRFTFAELHASRYTLRIRAPGFAERVLPDVDVPSPTGKYDIQFP